MFPVSASSRGRIIETQFELLAFCACTAWHVPYDEITLWFCFHLHARWWCARDETDAVVVVFPRLCDRVERACTSLHLNDKTLQKSAKGARGGSLAWGNSYVGHRSLSCLKSNMERLGQVAMRISEPASLKSKIRQNNCGQWYWWWHQSSNTEGSLVIGRPAVHYQDFYLPSAAA